MSAIIKFGLFWPYFNDSLALFSYFDLVTLRGVISAYVVPRVMARRRHCIRSLERWQDICKATRRRNGMTVRIPPTAAHEYESHASRDLAKPHAVGTRLW
ncbi:hypothetical protein AVEN_261572-1 [Araneus ventricosus]|uniref:Uncharacterized protein n=1 Tax=Araneus ventricosus TaxID=182803 RepID=A0A4Y2EC84_ARAVE|nr:hypothetical protein AVEN_261572-1 [Araneus ventricosus]